MYLSTESRLNRSKSKPKDGKQEIRIEVDLDKEQGRAPATDRATGQPKAPEIHKVTIKFVKHLSMASIESYLAGTSAFDIPCLEVINFLDHVMREDPTKRLISIKQSFFDRGTQRHDLGGGLEAFKGVYASMRLACKTPGAKPVGVLSVNVDVNNSAFWKESSLGQICQESLMRGKPTQDFRALSQYLGAGTPNSRVHLLRSLKRLMIYTRYVKGQSVEDQKKRPMKINSFLNKTAKQHMLRDMQVGENQPARNISVFDYFQQKWNIRLQYPDLPVVQMHKQIRGNFVVLPMELCFLSDAQRYVGRLSGDQTTKMLAFAATIPSVRWGAVEKGKSMLNWQRDPVLNAYGLKINDSPETVNAKLLTAPEVAFSSGGNEKPGNTGRWKLMGKKFYKLGAPLMSWGVCNLDEKIGDGQLRAWIGQFKSTLNSHGVSVPVDPYVHQELFYGFR